MGEIGAMGSATFEHDRMLLCVILALFLSFASFAAIFGLDTLADASWTSDDTDEVIREIIRVLGLLIGFAWEQTFDQAEIALAQRTPCPALVKVALAVFSVSILVPAWRFQLLPMANAQGCKLGFILEDVENEWGSFDKLAQ